MSCAPAFRDSTRTPPVRLTAGPSMATRFMPSMTGFTISTSYIEYAATARSSSSRMITDTGFPVGSAELVVDALRGPQALPAVGAVLGDRAARGIQQRQEPNASSQRR